MPNFKPKPPKKLKYVKNKLLDNKHTELMSEFQNIKQNVIQDLKKNLKN